MPQCTFLNVPRLTAVLDDTSLSMQCMETAFGNLP